MIYKTFHFRTLLYLLPAVFIFLTFNVIPGLTSLVLSFFDFTGFETNLFRNFVGIDNFIKIYDQNYSLVVIFFSNPVSKFLFSLFIINAYFFSALSICEVFEDYI